MLVPLALAITQPGMLSVLQQAYGFECTAKDERGITIVLSGKLTKAEGAPFGKAVVADMSLSGASSPEVAGEYGAVLFGDVVVLDNLPQLLTQKLSIANRIIIDRTVLGPGTVMVKSTARTGSGTKTYFGFCEPRAQTERLQ